MEPDQTVPQHVGYNITENGLSLIIDSQNYILGRDHEKYFEVLQAVRERRYADVAEIMAPPKPGLTTLPENVFEGIDDGVVVRNGIVIVDGKEFTPEVSAKSLRMINGGMPVLPMARHLRKILENKSSSAQRELLLFEAANDFLIHEDGDIIAYKKVGLDYRPSHPNKDGTYFVNTVGAIISMPRDEVDDRRNVTCSFGLHAAAHDYATGFHGSRMVVLKIHPKDVVAVPEDYHNQKMRVCRYEVISEITNKEMMEKGLPSLEVFTDADLGVGKGVVPQHIPANMQRIHAEIQMNSTLARLAEVVADWLPNDITAERIIGWALTGDVSLQQLGVRVSQPATDYDWERFRELAEAIGEEFNLSVFGGANVDSVLREDWDGWEINDLVDRLDFMRDSDENDLESEDDADENDEEWKPFEIEEEYEVSSPVWFLTVVEDLKEKIITREVFDHSTFRRAVEKHCALDDETRQMLVNEGFGRWL